MSPGPWAEEVYARLITTIKPLGSVIVALSGGVDSALVLEACVQALGQDQVWAATLAAPYIQADEFLVAQTVAKQCRVVHLKLEAKWEPLRYNPPERCYLCKQDLFIQLRQVAKTNGLAQVVEGSNSDDAYEHRPGAVACAEQGIVSPLQRAGLDKAQVRALAKWRGLFVWDKPSQTCLLTRFGHDQLITSSMLNQVGSAEKIIRELGFSQVRVRHQGQVACIEVRPKQVSALLRIQSKAQALFEGLGFTRMVVTQAGYQSRAYKSAKINRKNDRL